MCSFVEDEGKKRLCSAGGQLLTSSSAAAAVGGRNVDLMKRGKKLLDGGRESLGRNRRLIGAGHVSSLSFPTVVP